MSVLNEFKDRFRRLLELRQERDIAKKAFERAERDYRFLEAELFAELEEAGIRGRISFDFGGDLGSATFQRRRTIYGRVLDKETAVRSLEAEGLDDVIYERSVREGRLNELARDRVDSSSDLPEGVDFYDRKGISISRKSV